jgi:branched-chain amino acid transport system permease protein
MEVLVAGLLNGLVYALVAVGLSLIWGITEVLNFAHGEFLMLGAYTAYWLYTIYQIDPLFSAPLVAIVLAFVGFLTYTLVIRRVMNGPPLAQILATFGLALCLRYSAFYFFSPDFRSIPKTLVSGSVDLGLFKVGLPQFATGIVALVVLGIMFYLVYRTRWGLALRAVAENKKASSIVGIDPDRVNLQVWMLGSAAVGVAGAMLTTFFYVYPEVGVVFGLTAFVAVALGGFGSVVGAFLGGVLIGVVEATAGFLITPAFKSGVVFLAFLLVLWFRPQGIFGRY